MTRAAKAMVLLALGFACAGAARGQEPSRVRSDPSTDQPFEIVRSIHAVQDQVVRGNTNAQAKLPKLVARIGERLLGLDPATWRDAKNARAAVVYGLSGGQVRVLREIVKSNVCPEPEKTLLEGALAYVEGHEAKAKQILLPIDARTLSPFVGGHVAMVQSILVAREAPRKALAFLDQARVLAPGTLIEEASLRRAVLLADEIDDLDVFVTLSSQYIRRFHRSVYAANFRQRFAASVIRFGLAGGPGQLGRLESVLNEIDPGDRLSHYLTWARTAIIGGKVDSARFAAGKAAQLARDTTIEAGRAKLYEGVTLVLTNEIESGLGRLESLEASPLPKPDVELRDIAIAMAKHIRARPDESSAPIGLEPFLGVSLSGRDNVASASASGLIDLAQKALDETNELLVEERP